MRNDVIRLVKIVICDVFGLTNEDVADNTSLKADLALDSFDIMCMALEIEHVFGIELPEGYFSRIRDINVSEIADIVTTRIEKQQKSGK